MPVAKWIRVRFDNKLIANSRRVMLKRGFPLFYYFQLEDVDQDLLENSDRSEKDDRGKKVFYHVKSGERQQDNAAWVYEKPSDEAPENLENYIAFEWKAMDSWLEEDEPAALPLLRKNEIHLEPGAEHR